MSDLELKYQAALMLLAAMTDMFYEHVDPSKAIEFSEEHFARFKRATKNFPQVQAQGSNVAGDMLSLEYKA